MTVKPTIEDELRARAAALTDRPESWVQADPVGKGQQCLVYRAGTLRYNDVYTSLRVLSNEAEAYLGLWMGEHLDDLGIDETNRVVFLTVRDRLGVSVTGYNDNIAESVHDVIRVLEKAAADYDG